MIMVVVVVLMMMRMMTKVNGTDSANYDGDRDDNDCDDGDYVNDDNVDGDYGSVLPCSLSKPGPRSRQSFINYIS